MASKDTDKKDASGAGAEKLSTEDTLIQQRRDELARLRDTGWNFPNSFVATAYAAKLHAEFDAADNDALEKHTEEYALAGRIVLKRTMGKASFFTLQDASGRMQIYARQDALGEAEYEETQQWDLGDIVGISGKLFKTKAGELSIKVAAAKILVKSLRPLPEKYHGLTDTEQRYRRRYLDLLLNSESAKVFHLRSKIIHSVREFFNERDFLEVETPMMQSIAGGATAKPFETHHNALSLHMFLRIAPELYLKRLLVGGFDKVFEINRNFRNEGLSTKHNPEFTMLEFYQAFTTYESFMDLVEELIKRLAKKYYKSKGKHKSKDDPDLASKFARISHEEAVLKFNSKLSSKDYADMQAMSAYAKSLGIKMEKNWTLGKVQNEIFEKTVEEKLIQPTFVVQYPKDVSPLSKRNEKDPEVADRFEFFVGGVEIANGFSELNDPDEQSNVFHEQAKHKSAGDEEAMNYDEDFITALEYGMPPAAGTGIGIDRLVMLLTSSDSIRDVILFPQLRPEGKEGKEEKEGKEGKEE